VLSYMVRILWATKEVLDVICLVVGEVQLPAKEALIGIW